MVNLPQNITIVSGLPRSGTSMMMQMLSAGGMSVLTDHMRTADEDNLRGYFEFERAKQIKEDTIWLPDAVGKVVKMIYFLLYDLPTDYHFRVIFMQRSLDEVIRSQQIMLQRRGERGAGLASQQMAEVFQRQLEKMDDWLADQPNFEKLDVRFQDVIRDSSAEAARVQQFVLQDLDVAAMAEAVDPTLFRQRSDSTTH